jgi:hypothetical protein
MSKLPNIKEHISQGSLRTFLSTFEVTYKGLDVLISKGDIFQGGTKILSSDEVVVPIPVSSESLDYTFFITNHGLEIQVMNDSEMMTHVEDLLMYLAWFHVPANTTSLSDVEVINVAKVVDSNEI